MTNLPDNIFGINAKEAYDRVLGKLEKKPEQEEAKKDIDLDLNLEDYILLPKTKEHPDLLIAKNRLSYDGRIKKLAERWPPVYFDLKNSEKGYISEIDFFKAKRLLKDIDSFMINPNLFVEFLNLLKSKNVVNGKKELLDSSELETILKEIIEVRNPWRAEWLNHLYTTQKIDRTPLPAVIYQTVDQSGKLYEVTEVLDGNVLAEKKTPGTSLENWLKQPNLNGLPRLDNPEGDLFYWPPKEDKVAIFGGDSRTMSLQLDASPETGNKIIGVREAKIYRGSQ